MSIHKIIKLKEGDRVLFYPGSGNDYSIISPIHAYLKDYTIFIYCDAAEFNLRKANPKHLFLGCADMIQDVQSGLSSAGMAIISVKKQIISDEIYCRKQNDLLSKHPSYKVFLNDKIRLEKYKIKCGRDLIDFYYFFAEAVAFKNTLFDYFSNEKKHFTVYLKNFTGGGWVAQDIVNSITGPLLTGLDELEIPLMMNKRELPYFKHVNEDYEINHPREYFYPDELFYSNWKVAESSKS